MSLQRLFEPRSIAVVGASRSRTKIGNGILRNIIASEYRGALYPVNPKESRIEGRRCYPTVLDIPYRVDLAIVAIPAPFVVTVFEQCTQKKVKAAIIISSGFKETGGQGTSWEKKLIEIAGKSGVRFLGPNCLGIINTERRLNASFTSECPAFGNVSFISQSGAIIVSLVDWALNASLGLQKLVSVGNEADLTAVELLEYLADDKKTKVIGMYVEQITNVPRFMEVASRVSKIKPIVVLKAGDSAAAQKAAVTHTGSLASDQKIISAVLRQSGVIEVNDIEELFNVLLLLSRGNNPASSDLTILSNAGGAAIIAVDIAVEEGLHLQNISGTTRKRLARILPREAALGNPIDILGDADLPRFEAALRIVLSDRSLKNICVLVTPQNVTPVVPLAKLLVRLQRETDALLSVSFIGGKKAEAGRIILRAGGVLHYDFPYDALHTLAISKQIYKPHNRYHAPHRESISTTTKLLPFRAVQDILARYQFPLIQTLVIKHESEVHRIRSFPVAIKVLSLRAVHKARARAVVLHVTDRSRARRVVNDFRRRFGGRGFEGIAIQPMAPQGLECIMGVRRTHNAGAAVLLGVGGTYAEVLNDTAIRIAPLGASDAMSMIDELRQKDLFRSVDRAFVAKQLQALSHFAITNPEIVELDLNPIIVYTKGGVIVDARIISTT